MTLEGELAIIMMQGFESTPDAVRRQLAVKDMHSSSILKIHNECKDISDDSLHEAPKMKTKRLLPTNSTSLLLLYITSAEVERVSLVIKI